MFCPTLDLTGSDKLSYSPILNYTYLHLQLDHAEFIEDLRLK